MVKFVSLLTLSLCTGPLAHAFAADRLASDHWIGRYSTVAPVPTASQQDPLSVVTTLTFPATVQTIGDAINYLLMSSGFSLSQNHSSELDLFLSLPLPVIHRSLGPITVDRALSVIVGYPWQLVTDPLHRQVSFELSSSFASPALLSTSAVPPATDIDPPNDSPVVLASASDIASPASATTTVVDYPVADADSFLPNKTSSLPGLTNHPASANPTATPPHSADHFATLDETASLDIRDQALKPALDLILPGWRIDLFISDPSIANGTLNLSATDTRENILFEVTDRIGLHFYTYTDRTPPVLVISDTPLP